MIIIVGSGPIGLYIAVALAKRGYQPIQVVDRHSSKFSRPGVVAVAAGEIITRQLRQLGIDLEIPLAGSYPESYYIRDIQRALRAEAEKLGVTFIPAHFESIHGGNIQVGSNSEPIPCSLLIDCSGESRNVVRYVNQNSGSSKDVFTISTIAHNPVKSNFIAFIKLSAEYSKILNAPTIDPSNAAKMLEQLRKQGWNRNDLPHWDMRQLSFNEGDHLFCCYCEIPEDLARGPESAQEEWLATMLCLKTGSKIIFEREPGPLRFSAFEVSPCKVENPILAAGPHPFPIAVCGDAMMSAEYRKGTGISNGIICANGLVQAIRYDRSKKHYVIDVDIFNHTLTGNQNPETCVQTHTQEIQATYLSRQNTLSNVGVQAKKINEYINVHLKLPADENIKKELLFQIKELKSLGDKNLTLKKYTAAVLAYENALHACAILEKNPSTDLTEVAQLYNLKSRIYSNLARIHAREKNPEKSRDALKNSIEACTHAIQLLENNKEDITTLKTELPKLLQSLQARLENRTSEPNPPMPFDQRLK